MNRTLERPGAWADGAAERLGLRQSERPAPRRPAVPPSRSVPAARPVPSPRRSTGSAARESVGRFLHHTSAANGARGAAVESLSPRQTRRRLALVCVAILALFAVVVSRLVALQMLDSQKLSSLNVAQRMRSQTLPADRGAILDRNGVELALSLPQESVFVDPTLVEDPRVAAEALAPVLGLPVDELLSKVTRDGERRFVYLARHVEPGVAEKVAALQLKGIALVEEPKRYTPSGDVASALVGLTDIDSKPMSGLEKRYDDLLTGTPGKLAFEQAPDGRTIPVGENVVLPAKKGTDLVLTVDRTMQYEVQRILADQVRSAQAKGGIAVVTRPGTGEILAAANVVADPTTGEVKPSADNAALTNVYEPGSVMKIVATTGAIEDGLVTPETVLQLPVSYQIADASFSDAEPRGPVAWSVKDIITNSSNVGTIMVAQKLGKQRLYGYQRAFGFGEKTPIDFPNEQAGVIPRPEKWWATSMGTEPIGQGLSVTPVQMLMAYNVIANRGTYVAPRLVSDLIDADGVRRPFPQPEPRQVVSPATADKLNLILRNVVSQGTGTHAAVDGYTVAGKTGTSRKPQSNGTYVGPDGITHYMSTFVGFAPAEAPEVSVIVIIDDPGNGQIFGGLVAAPAFSKITEFALRVLGVAPPATDGPNGNAPADPKVQAALVSKGTAYEAPSFTTLPDGRKRALPSGQTTER